MSDQLSQNPFAAPLTQAQGDENESVAFEPIDGRVRATTTAIWFAVAAHAAYFIGIHTGILDATALDVETEAGFSDAAMALSITAVAIFLGMLASMVLTAMTLPRANRNARLLAEGIQFSPASTVWWYFVPFMNLVRPYQAMAEMWNGSEPNAQVPWTFTRSTPTLLNVWWAAWLGALAMEKVEDRLFNHDMALSSVLFIVAGVLFIRILAGLARRQTLRRQSLEAVGRFPGPFTAHATS